MTVPLIGLQQQLVQHVSHPAHALPQPSTFLRMNVHGAMALTTRRMTCCCRRCTRQQLQPLPYTGWPDEACNCGLISMLQLPPGVVTGLDAVTYFGSGAGKPSDLIYCNLASCLQCGSTAGHGAAAEAEANPTCTESCQESKRSVNGNSCGCANCQYNPYDLIAVPQQDADKQQHFIVSYNGVIHMRYECVGVLHILVVAVPCVACMDDSHVPWLVLESLGAATPHPVVQQVARASTNVTPAAGVVSRQT